MPINFFLFPSITFCLCRSLVCFQKTQAALASFAPARLVFLGLYSVFHRLVGTANGVFPTPQHRLAAQRFVQFQIISLAFPLHFLTHAARTPPSARFVTAFRIMVTMFFTRQHPNPLLLSGVSSLCFILSRSMCAFCHKCTHRPNTH